MASDDRAISYADVVPGRKTSSATIRWSRAVPMMLLVPIVFAFGAPAFAFALLIAVLSAPAVVAVIALLAARHEHGSL